jgi:hypothetical protein
MDDYSSMDEEALLLSPSCPVVALPAPTEDWDAELEGSAAGDQRWVVVGLGGGGVEWAGETWEGGAGVAASEGLTAKQRARSR